jgi:hypothetical protein
VSVVGSIPPKTTVLKPCSFKDTDLRGLSSFRTQKRNSRQLLKTLFVKDKSNKVDRLCSIVEEKGFGRRSCGGNPLNKKA